MELGKGAEDDRGRAGTGLHTVPALASHQGSVALRAFWKAPTSTLALSPKVDLSYWIRPDREGLEIKLETL